MIFFDISEAFLHHALSYLGALYPINREDDYVYYSVYKGYIPETRFKNALSVCATLKSQQRDKTITITDYTYSSAFVLKMFIEGDGEEEYRTFYIVDTALLSIPFYALEDVLKAEVMGNGFHSKNRIIIIIYEDTKAEYIDLKCPVFMAKHIQDDNGCRFKFYDNKWFKREEQKGEDV